jgi:CO dehydrogenase nickel-insertion accessory protein CooC1
LLGQLESGRRAIVADMEAGLGMLTRMDEGSLDRALLVTDASPKSIEVTRRAREIIAERKITATTLVIANRVRGAADLEHVRLALGDVDLVAVPEDAEITRADFHGLSPVDAAPDSPAVQALTSLARSWTQELHHKS